ncbi:MAG: NAD(P)-binding protein [Rhizobiales bacterium]|nr:NAD(P)-binding protein [Hyphomicrobiales bacterium]
MASMHDAVIVGGGHNGLVCGTYLARAGLRTLVLERRPLLGGACVTEELWPGYRLSTGSYVMTLMQPKVILDLDLLGHGLTVIPTPPTFAPMDDGGSIVFWGDEDRFCAELARYSPRDAAAYPEYRRNLERLAPFIRRIIWETPPDVASRRPRDLLRTARFLLRYHQFADRFYELYDVLTMSAFDYLRKWFESDAVITALGYYVPGGGTNASMRMPGTAFSCIRPLVRDNTTAAGPSGLVRGGMGALTGAIAAAGRAEGLEIRTGAEVARIECERGAATGVRLTNGEFIPARTVVANADAKSTFLRLMDSAILPEGFVRDVRAIRTNSSIFKVHLAVSELPRYSAFSPAERGFDYPVGVRIGPSVDYLEEAFDDYRKGRFSRHPFLTVYAPSVLDPTLAPPGHHVLSIMGGHAPYRLADRDWNEARGDLLEATIATIERHAPGVRSSILHSEVLTPADLEARFGLPEGHVHHGDLTIDQQFIRRPVGGFADYRTPVANLYLCGSSAHPGGGVTGVPGHNAAREILKDRRR